MEPARWQRRGDQQAVFLNRRGGRLSRQAAWSVVRLYGERTGLVDRLSQEEVAGVLSHELGHVRNRDTLTMTIAATLAGAIGMLAQFGLFFGGGRDEEGRPVNPVVAIAAAILAPIRSEEHTSEIQSH